METVVVLRKIDLLEKIKDICDGIIVGSKFTSGFYYNTADLKYLRGFCAGHGLQFYVLIDNFISEDDKDELFDYFEFIMSLDVDGIYYHDLGVFEIARLYNSEDKMIYDGQTVMCNSLDVAYHLSHGLKAVQISRELTYDEVKEILLNNPYCCDMQVFGHLRLSYSKRRFLTNYFKQIGEDYDYLNNQNLYLIEEQRDYRMPIVEDNSGTKIYSDYVFQMYKELEDLRVYIARGIIETMFVNDDRIVQVLRDYRRTTSLNADFLLNNLNNNYPDNYSTGYLYEKTNITKDE